MEARQRKDAFARFCGSRAKTTKSIRLHRNDSFRKYPEPRAAHHRYGIGGQQLLWGHGGEVGDVRQGVDQGHQWDRNVDGTRKVPRGGNILKAVFKPLRTQRNAEFRSAGATASLVHDGVTYLRGSTTSSVT